MRNESLSILAVNPGSRYVGVAIFRGLDLYDWRVRTVRESLLQEKAAAVTGLLAGIIDRYDINMLVVKKIHPSRSSKNLEHILREIRGLARKRDMDFRELTIDDVERRIDSERVGNKRLLMDKVAARYPDLYLELEREKRNKNPYLVRMFEAVALGVACLHETDMPGRKVGQKK
jgi:hypothetical protein